MAASAPEARVSVVIITRDRRDSLLTTLAQLVALPESPPVIVVDNGSSDGTVEAVRRAYRSVRTVALPENRGAAGRNEGMRVASTPYVAFADDDSWWAPGALSLAAGLFDAHRDLAVIAGRILVGQDARLDPVCAEMASSPLGLRDGLPGPEVLGFVACGSVVRVSAVLSAGGFHRRYGVGGEEELLALDLAAAGWAMCYVDGVVAHHHPSASRDPARRRRTQQRNALWTAWLRRAAGAALAYTARIAWEARRDPAIRAGLIEALAGLGWVLRERRSLPRAIEADRRALDRRGTTGHLEAG